MCFSKKYKKYIASLEFENEELKAMVSSQCVVEEMLYARITMLDDEIVELNRQIADLKAELERQGNGKYSLYLIKEDGTKWFNEPYSVEEMISATGISRATIMNSLTKSEPLKGGRNAKYDSKYIGSQVVSAD